MTGWFFTNLAGASMLMLVVLAVRRPFARLFGAGPAYALWLLPALRLVMPPLPAWPVPSPLPSQALIVWAEDAAAPLPPDGGSGQWMPILLALWALGAAALVIWQILAYRRLLARLSLGSRSLGAHRGLPLIESGAVQGPLALGLLDRRIVVPLDFTTRYTEAERGLALDHETVHHRRGDIWWNHVALVILALSWFSPVAWLAFRAFRADQELACDAAVTGAASAETRAAYAQALVKSASRPGLIAACPLNHADQLKRRLRMMKDHRRSRPRMLGGAAALMLLAGLGIAAGTPGVAQPGSEAKAEAAPDERRGERVIIRERRRLDDGAASASGGAPAERRERTIVIANHDGPRPRLEMGRPFEVPEGCGDLETDASGPDDVSRTRVVYCGYEANSTPAQAIAQLERARARLSRESELDAEARQRILAAIDREIARQRALP